MLTNTRKQGCWQLVRYRTEHIILKRDFDQIYRPESGWIG
jgi:hypothetical protein